MQNYYQFLIPRLNGKSVKKDFPNHLSLVKKGIAGFIIFGGRLDEMRKYIKELQDESEIPLIIASDLERGLGQQVQGGTHFPPAMALAKAVTKKGGKAIYNLPLLRKIFTAMAGEAAYAGINTILAPVLDINTNPKNPIIATRAFGEEEKTVSLFGAEMIRTLQKNGIAACGKHFPGHGDTEVDSHIRLPVIRHKLINLKRNELKPFKVAIKAGVGMIMLGHLSVPALDQSQLPVSFSKKAVRFLREDMGYDGILITDAMNMGGIGAYSEEKASFMALDAGVDLVLHPTDVERVVSFMGSRKKCFDLGRIEAFRRSILSAPVLVRPDFDKDRRLSGTLTDRSIISSGRFVLRKTPFLVILNDEDEDKGNTLIRNLRKGMRGMKYRIVSRSSKDKRLLLPEDIPIIVAIFSETKGWKGGSGNWLYEALSQLERRSELVISFGSPYLLDGIKGPAKISAFWDADSAQEAVARIVIKKHTS
ncbi:MAG TPA: glycoside hydrolase family 3 N-terminal domain-containing protein [Candidatus Sulfobium mesophilum]|nr:glycoside hydrolase family 3 N-terminal domain-containing protein [Candidatus Sulfobium mesophilum]